jgi:23S rRNA pseudouridine2605 synthase
VERLQKFMSECGVASRRKSEELITAGYVKINGTKAVLGDKVDPRRDRVTVHGKLIKPVEEKVYIMLNKPRGYITSTTDDRGRKCVTELTRDVKTKIYPVGRLDRDSEGLLLMTNDGEFANQMMHPRSQIDKTYRVTVRGSVSEEQLTTMSVGVEIDGRGTEPCTIDVLEKDPAAPRTVLQFVIHEGRNRQIRRMCEAVGLEVMRLRRTAISTVKLGMLQTGKWRELTEQELRRLRTDALRSSKDEVNENGSNKTGRRTSRR